MKTAGKGTAAKLALMALFLALAGLTSIPVAETASGANGQPGKVLKIYSVGAVLTSDGTLWEYRPDRGRWMTIDEAFKDQGRDTHVLPLPVPAESIAEMVTFGFLRTTAGDCWLYDIEKDKWEKLPPPPRR